jgi:hypothetical protein
MVVIDDVKSILWPQNHGNHVPTEELPTLVATLRLPLFALRLDLTHPDRDLCRVQIANRDRMQDRFSDRNHRTLL